MLTDEARQASRAHPFAEPSSAASTPLTFAAWAAGVVARWRLVAAVTAATIALTLLATVVIAPVYRSTSSFVANAGGGLKLPAGLAGLSGIASQLGVSAGVDPSESPAFYTQLLQSRELLTRLVLSRYRDPRSASPADSATLIQLFDIKKRDQRRALELAIKRASKKLRATADLKTNLVTLTGDAEWPELSAAMVNRAVGLVNAFNLEQRVSRARQKREFVERRAGEARRDLTLAESRLRDFYEQNRQWRTSPALTFEQGQLDRQVTIANDIYMTLSRELETARISELNDAALITVVDSAVAPRRALWPRYPLALGAAVVVGLLFGLMAAGLAALVAHWASQNAVDAINLRLAARRAATELRTAIRPARRGGMVAAPNGPHPGD